MIAHPPTLMAVSVFVTALCGTLLVFTWWQSRPSRALAWWGTSFLTAAAALVLFAGRGTLSGFLSIVLANAAMLLAFGILWAGMRVFEGRRVSRTAVVAGAFVWLCACGVPDFYRSFGARVVLASALTALYFGAAAFEIWRGRDERLLSRYPLAAILAGHGLVMAARIPLVLLNRTHEGTVVEAPWILTHTFEALLFTISTAMLLVSIGKERVERAFRLLAERDALTGLLNRRAFLQEGEAMLTGPDKPPAALLLLDLDRFRTINERLGQSIGDEALRSFAACARLHLPPDAVFARFGGEEFACLLPRTDEDDALALADRIRQDVGLARFTSARGVYRLTVSVGVASTPGGAAGVEALVSAADGALFDAKASEAGIGHRPAVQAA